MSWNVWVLTGTGTNGHTTKYSGAVTGGAVIYTDHALTASTGWSVQLNKEVSSLKYGSALYSGSSVIASTAWSGLPTHHTSIAGMALYKNDTSGTKYYDVAASAVTVYTRSASATFGSITETTGGGDTWSGAAFTATAVANRGYELDYWYDSKESGASLSWDVSEDKRTSTLTHPVDTRDRAFVAKFKLVGYDLDVVNGTSTPTEGYFYVGDSIVLSPTVPANKEFVQWAFTGGLTGTSSNPNYTFNMPAADVKATASFRDTRYTLTVTPPVGGTADVYRSSTIGGEPTVQIATGITAAQNFTSITAGFRIRVVATLPYTHVWSYWDANGTTYDATDVTLTMPYAVFNVAGVAAARTFVNVTVINSAPTLGRITVERFDGTVVADVTTATPAFFTLYNGLGYRFTGTAYSGAYQLDHWERTIDGGETETLTANPYEVEVDDELEGDRTQEYFFALLPAFSLDIGISDGDSEHAEGGHPEDDLAVLAGCSSVISPTPDYEGEYYPTTLITVTALGAIGWTFTSFRWIQGEDDIVYSEGMGGLSVGEWLETKTSYITADTEVWLRFTPTLYPVEVEVDVASIDADAGSVKLYGFVTVVDDPEAVPPVTHIEDVELTSPYDSIYNKALKAVATAKTHYAFEGWYIDGVKVTGALSTYLFNVAGPTRLVAKFSINVPFDVLCGGASQGALNVVTADGATVLASAPTTITVTCGDKFYLQAVVLNADSHFRGYYYDGSIADPLFEDQTGAIIEVELSEETGWYFAEPITAVFSEAGDYVYLRMTNDADEDNEHTGFGLLAATNFVDELDEEEYEAVMSGLTPGTSEDPGRNRYYKFERGTDIIISALQLNKPLFKKWYVSDADVTDSGPLFSLETLLSPNNPAALKMYRNLSVRAEWRYGEYIQVSGRYATGSDSTMGLIMLNPPGDYPQDNYPTGVSGQYLDDDVVTLTAAPYSTYKFKGWYNDIAASDEDLVSTDPTIEITVFADSPPEIYYALFEQDSAAVYTWEGGTAPKMTTWRSKRMAASVPFDPSAVRVFADGYPLTVNIYACSSPNAPSPTSPTKQAYVMSENPVRLVSGRKEKYFEVEIKSSFQVLEFVMSTSLGGLVQ